MFKILKLLGQNEKKQLIFIIIFIVFLGISESLTFFFLKPIFNHFNESESTFQITYLKNFFSNTNLYIYYLIGIFIIFFILRFILTILVHYKRANLVRNINNDLSNKVYSYYISNDYQFFINNSNSKLTSNTITEVEKFSYRVIDCLIGFVTEIFLVTGVLVFLFITYFYISFILLSISLFFFLLAYNLYKNKFKNIGNIKVHNDACKIDVLQKSFYIIQSVKLDNLENYFINEFKKNTQNSSKSHFILSYFSELPKPIIELFVLAIVLILVSLFYYNFDFNKKEILEIFAIYGVAMFRILPSLNRIFGYLNQLKFHYSTTEIITDIFRKKKVEDNHKVSQEKYLGFKKIIFENVSFNYKNNDNLILRNVNLVIHKGEIIGISGKSGSGKSTLLNLLCFLLKPTSGKVLIDNQNLENIYKSFQSKIAYVTQKVYLTDGSIIENIILGKSKDCYNYKIFKEVIDICGLADFINNLQDKEESLIGERGTKLSGGQQQKLGIARALYKQPDILILDEATNALDEESEKEILKLITNLNKKTTIILVSHKESVLHISKKIYEIENNQINQIK
jgi:ATP-binding cassette, subfamily B, bacterial PglK